jgi:hypothetical protein
MAGNVCGPIVPGSCNCSPTGKECEPACTSTSCAAGEQCLASGHCQTISCTMGYPCAAGFNCLVGGAGADAHGCAPAPCAQGGYVCPAGTTCLAALGADPHGCSPIHCSATQPCPVNMTCDPAAPGQGCKIRRCTGDGDCDCGACVGGTCAPYLGICASAPA